MDRGAEGPPLIATKRQFYRLWRAGLLGNRPRTWADADALRDAAFDGEVTMRTAGGAGGQTHYRLSVLEAVRLARYEREATFNESMPDEALTIQGEVTRAPGGLYLRCDRTPGLKMKDAMAVAKDAWGVHAKLVLDHFLWPNSLDDVEILLDTYPDHVVEFSTYDRAVGDQPRRNTIIWEVRSY